MTRTAAPLRPRSWSAVQCRADDLDQFIVDRVRPLLDGRRMAGQLADWYFQRAADDVLVIGLRGADWCSAQALRADLAKVAGGVAEAEHAVDAGFGPAAPAEDVFCRGTELAVATLAAGADKQTAATELVVATAHALRLDRAATAGWLGGGAPGGRPLDVRWTRLARTRDHDLIRWTNAVRRARRAAEGQAEAPVAGQWREVWREHLVRLLNRVGITPAQTRALFASTAAALAIQDPFASDPLHLDLAAAV
ncbi:lantibiotic dehydratase C-terminal domain-containing protein [Actinokineospora sp. NPDC004072]